MRLFPVPYSITEEEKIFGGYLSLRQVIYLAVSVILSVLLFFSAFLPLSLRLFLGLMLVSAGASLAFIKVANIGLDRYLKFAVLYFVHQKRFCFAKEGSFGKPIRF